MTKRLMLSLCLVLLAMPSMTILAQDIQVVVLPFDVHSLEDLKYLKTEITKLIKSQLKSEGAVILKPPIEADPSWRDQLKGIFQR